MKRILFSFLLLFAAVSSFGQVENYNKEWVQGTPVAYKTTFDASGTVSQFWPNSTTNNCFDNSHSNICNGAGNVIIATNGLKIYDGSNNVMDGGDSMVSTYVYNTLACGFPSQTTIILPLGDSIYYVFSGIWSDTAAYYGIEIGDTYSYPGPDFLYYHVVDMKENSYTGKVIKPNRIAMDSIFTSGCQMTAVKHGNGKDWWLVRNGIDHNGDSSILYTFLVQQDTVLGPYVQAFIHPATGNTNVAAYGQAEFSNDGKLYVNEANSPDASISLAEFDRCTGVFLSQQRIKLPHFTIPGYPLLVDSIPNGVCFSPNDSFLYVLGFYSVMQYEIYNPDSATAWVQLGGIDTAMSAFQGYMTISAAHDGKVYLGNFGGGSYAMSSIENPNVKGMAAGFCAKCLDFPQIPLLNGSVQEPPNMPNYVLGTHPGCTTAVPETKRASAAFVLYPNPADAMLIIESRYSGRLELVDMLGRIVLQKELVAGKTTMSTLALPEEIYSYRIISNRTHKTSGRIIIKHD